MNQSIYCIPRNRGFLDFSMWGLMLSSSLLGSACVFFDVELDECEEEPTRSHCQDSDSSLDEGAGGSGGREGAGGGASSGGEGGSGVGSGGLGSGGLGSGGLGSGGSGAVGSGSGGGGGQSAVRVTEVFPGNRGFVEIYNPLPVVVSVQGMRIVVLAVGSELPAPLDATCVLDGGVERTIEAESFLMATTASDPVWCEEGTHCVHSCPFLIEEGVRVHLQVQLEGDWVSIDEVNFPLEPLPINWSYQALQDGGDEFIPAITTPGQSAKGEGD